MKYAAAIRFGGDLVQAEECDYNSYKHLGLLCPECKDPVFLKAGGERTRGETVYQVGAHFSHFAAKDPAIVAQCERRVSQYGVAELAKRASVARNQRLKVMQRYLWRIFQDYYENAGFPVGSILLEKSVPIQELSVSTQAGEFLLADMITTLFQGLDQRGNREYLGNTLTAIRSGKPVGTGLKKNGYYIISNRIQDDFQKSVKGSVDWRLHELICYEVSEFLRTKKTYPLAKEIVTLAIAMVFDCMKEGATYGDLPPFTVIQSGGTITCYKDGSFTDLCYRVDEVALQDPKVFKSVAFPALDHIFVWLSCLPWASEFDRIRQQETKALVTANPPLHP